MRHPLLNLLACPMCKGFPLKLYVVESRVEEKEYSVSKPFCDHYCGRVEKLITDVDSSSLDCSSCVREDVLHGVLVCGKCGRWYPIINGIPFMYPDAKRQHPKVRAKEEEFIKKYKDTLPQEIREMLKL
ncbi:MAG: Trm112 family protein [Zestosphaera sp.]